MTNPNDSVGTNGAYGGRTSVNAINDVLASFSGRGILSGWNTTVSSGMTLSVGGSAGLRDVAIAEDNAGNRTTIDNRSSSPISVEIAAASSSTQRIDCVVAYVNNPPTVLVTTIDNPTACGIIAVQGTSSAPTESAIRDAITADGGTGSTAYYVVLATVTVPAGATDLSNNNVAQGSITSPNVDYATQKIPACGANTLQSFNNISSTTTYTMNHRGFLRGKTYAEKDSRAEIYVNGTLVEGGLPYIGSAANSIMVQFRFTTPVAEGDLVEFRISGTGGFQELILKDIRWV